MIVISHIFNHYSLEMPPAAPYYAISGIIDQICVVSFFLFSGYGLMQGYVKNGKRYNITVLTNHFLEILLYTIIFLIPFYAREFILNGFNKTLSFYLLLHFYTLEYQKRIKIY